jgi:hypothetical protein
MNGLRDSGPALLLSLQEADIQVPYAQPTGASRPSLRSVLVIVLKNPL